MNPGSLLARLDAHSADVRALCRKHRVRQLDVFGSVAAGMEQPDSDYDFLVEFESLPPGGYSSAFFGLIEDLQQLLGAPVDLIVERAIRNPYFREAVESTRKPIYAA